MELMKKNTLKNRYSRTARVLVLRNVHVSIEGREIVAGVTLSISPGEIHLLMGPNGSGKSTLLHAVAGHPRTTVTKGSMTLDGISLSKREPHERARAGLFLGFQQPVDIPGVTIGSFLRTVQNTLRTADHKTTISPTAFAAQLKEVLVHMGMDERFGGRTLNERLSGGEKKRGELLQMVVLEPRYALLDEFDSGLDVDAMRQVAHIISEQSKKGIGFLLVSHNPKLNDMLPITAVHVMGKGTFEASGGPELLVTIAKKGFGP
ncbi:Fe-S cluster assembly ATPase SufC [Candidatus Uhrbacteria bacterium]|nr:Fe-S cluster assembly ATPase SufC [Candidatus Uhrbacteria bacterium]